MNLILISLFYCPIRFQKRNTVNDWWTLSAELIGIFQRDEIDVALLNTAPPLLAFQVVRHGVVIYDPHHRYVSFYIDTFNHYADTQPLRDLQWQYYLKRQGAKSQNSRNETRFIMIDPEAVQALLQSLSEYTEDLRILSAAEP